MPRPRKKESNYNTKNLNARIPKELAKRLKVYCAEREITIQDFIIEAIEEKMQRKKLDAASEYGAEGMMSDQVLR